MGWARYKKTAPRPSLPEGLNGTRQIKVVGLVWCRLFFVPSIGSPQQQHGEDLRRNTNNDARNKADQEAGAK